MIRAKLDLSFKKDHSCPRTSGTLDCRESLFGKHWHSFNRGVGKSGGDSGRRKSINLGGV